MAPIGCSARWRVEGSPAFLVRSVPGTIGIAVARLLRHWTAEPSACAYLSRERASLEYRLMLDVSPGEMDALLERGWRRFGPAYFRPGGCQACSQCVPLRIPVARFKPSKQQRRVQRRTQRLEVRVGRPVVDGARLELYHRWHESQGKLRGWSADRIDAEEYFHQFAFPHPCVREFSYWDGASPGARRLVGVAIVDETPVALSAVYTFYEPALRRDSLGTASILFQVREAMRRNKRWLYLGYRVHGCPSSEYKARFRPHELLAGWPAFDEAPSWISAESGSLTDAAR